MPTGKLIYWDSCIFLAWLKNEKLDPAIMAGIEEVVKLVDEHKYILVTSTITPIEVLEADGIPGDARTQFTRLFDRPNVITIAVDTRVGKFAADIRNSYRKNKINLSVPDVIHLASAIINNVDEFHTLDGSGKRKRKSDLLALAGNVMGNRLQICVPYQTQLSLDPKPKEENIDGEKIATSEEANKQEE